MLRRPRLIPRLAVKGANVIVTVNLEGLRVAGKPAELARRYAAEINASKRLPVREPGADYEEDEFSEAVA